MFTADYVIIVQKPLQEGGMSFKIGAVCIALVFFIAVTVHADAPSWPIPVGERIIFQEYPSWEAGGPNGVGHSLVTDSSVWWLIEYSDVPLPKMTLVRRKLATLLGQEPPEEFPFDWYIHQFVVTANDQDALFWAWAVDESTDYLCDLYVPAQELRYICQKVLPPGSYYAFWPDVDDSWFVWERADQCYLLDWTIGECNPVLLAPGITDYPRISYPWVAWKVWEADPYREYGVARNLATEEMVVVDATGSFLDVDDGLLVYSVGEYLLTHLYVLDLNNPESTPYQISWDNGAEAPRIHNKLVVWDYYDGATGRSAIQGRDLETGLTFDIGVRGGMHSYDVRNNIVAWADRTYYPEAQVFIMLTRPYPLRGDLNGDNVVDISDIMLVVSHWRDAEGDPGYDKGWDLNWDGKVDILDIMLVVRHWGETWPPPTPTPTVTPTSTPRPSPIPIGGAIVPVNKLELLTPWICSGLLAFVTVTLLARMGGCSLGRVSESEFDRLPKT
jgi:hypothetical protein